MEIYACYMKAISSLILESPQVWMTVADWVQAQKADPTINQVVTLIKNKKLETVKMSGQMSHELEQYLRQRGKLCLWEGALYWHINHARWDHNELQLLVPPEYRLEAMCGAHNDEGHLSIKWMLNIPWDWFYWPNLEADVTHHIQICEWCLRFKGRQDKEDLYLLLATYPLELVHMDSQTIENPLTGVNVNILVITDHFKWYAKAIVTST